MGNFICFYLSFVVLFYSISSTKQRQIGEVSPFGMKESFEQYSDFNELMPEVMYEHAKPVYSTEQAQFDAASSSGVGESSKKYPSDLVDQMAKVMTKPSKQSTYKLASENGEIKKRRANKPLHKALQSDLNNMLSSFSSESLSKVDSDSLFSIPYGDLFAVATPLIESWYTDLNAQGDSLSDTNKDADVYSLFFSSMTKGKGLNSVLSLALNSALQNPQVNSFLDVFKGEKLMNGEYGETILNNLKSIFSILKEIDIDGESCMQMAMCSMGKIKRYRQGLRGIEDPMVEYIIGFFRLQDFKKVLSQPVSYAIDFGESGGDCNQFNIEMKCPITSDSIEKLILRVAHISDTYLF